MTFSRNNRRGAKLDAEKVLQIRRLYHEAMWTQRRLAVEFDVSEMQIGRIVRNEAWKLGEVGGALPPIKVTSPQVTKTDVERSAERVMQLLGGESAVQPTIQPAGSSRLDIAATDTDDAIVQPVDDSSLTQDSQASPLMAKLRDEIAQARARSAEGLLKGLLVDDHIDTDISKGDSHEPEST